MGQRFEDRKDNRMQERKPLSPKMDIVFQKLLGEQKNARLTKDLLEKILQREINCIDLSKTTRVTADMPDDKMGILDIRAELDGVEKCDIEMQMIDQKGLIERMLFYWSRLFTEGFKEGEEYEQLQKTIVILIANFKLKPLKDLGYHTKWKIIDEDERKVILTDKLEFHIIELPKIQGKEEEDDALLDWLFFLDDPASERAKKSMEENETIQEATEELNKLKDDEEMQRLALSRWIALSDYNTNMSAMKKEGMEEGMKAGIKEGIKEGKKEVAKELLKMKLSMQDIAKATGLIEEETKALQD